MPIPSICNWNNWKKIVCRIIIGNVNEMRWHWFDDVASQQLRGKTIETIKIINNIVCIMMSVQCSRIEWFVGLLTDDSVNGDDQYLKWKLILTTSNRNRSQKEVIDTCENDLVHDIPWIQTKQRMSSGCSDKHYCQRTWLGRHHHRRGQKNKQQQKKKRNSMSLTEFWQHLSNVCICVFWHSNEKRFWCCFRWMDPSSWTLQYSLNFP